MRRLFNYERLYKTASEQAAAYRAGDPFPHLVLDDAANPELLSEALSRFPSADDLKWYKYDNVLEKKLAMPHVELLPDVFREILYEFNSGSFIRFIEELSGVRGLVADPGFYGGGLHQIQRGGKLDIHADFNIHPLLKLDRRVNVIFFLNKNWEESYGGYLELWDKNMTRAVHRILPVFNRMVIFQISDENFHGHPDPLTCPEGWTRKSLALYYYSNGRPEAERSAPHSTIYKRRPQDPQDEETEALRVKRKAGRVVDLTT